MQKQRVTSFIPDTKWCSRTGSRRARIRGPQRDLPHKSKKNSQEQRCVRHSAARMQYHICLSNDPKKKTFSSSSQVLFMLGTTLLGWYGLKSQRWEMKGQLVEAFMKWSSYLARLLGSYATSSKKVITPYSEVEITSSLLGVKLDLIRFPSMCIMHG